MTAKTNSRSTENAQASRAEDEEECNTCIVVVRLFLFLSICSCATLTEEARFEREDRLILAKEQFYRQEASCFRQGGVMVAKPATTRLRKYDYSHYKLARCVKH
jgi:hypothetical protein